MGYIGDPFYERERRMQLEALRQGQAQALGIGGLQPGALGAQAAQAPSRPKAPEAPKENKLLLLCK